MKKFISILLLSITIISLTNSIAFGYNHEESKIALNNNFYIVVTITEDQSISRISNTKTGTKTITGYHGDSKCWDATIRGTFTYDGSSSTCTSASISYTIYNSLWKITSATATESGNKAIGNVIAKRYFLGIPTQTIEETVTLTCSANGTLS